MNPKNPLVYICGPLFSSGKELRNLREACRVARDMRAMRGRGGYRLVPFIPHLTIFMDSMFPEEEEFWMAWNLDLLRHCQAVFRFEGPSSINIKRELDLATELRIPVFHSLHKLDQYFDGEERL